LKIVGRVAFVTIASAYQPASPKLQHIQVESFLWLVAVVFLIGITITIVSVTLLRRNTRRVRTSATPPIA